MNFVPYYLQILKEGQHPIQTISEDMGARSEATPVELLKRCLPWLEVVSKTLKDGEHNNLMDLIVDIENIVGRGSITPGQDVWRQEMHGQIPIHKKASGTDPAFNGE